MEIFISLGQWWANIISAAVSVINSAGMWISLEDNASAEWPCCEFLAVPLWWAQPFAGAWIREKQVLRTAQPLTTKQLIIPSMLWSLSGFICKTEAWMATAQTDVQSQHPIQCCWAAFKGKAMREREWRARGVRWAGMEREKRVPSPLIYGKAVFPFSSIHINAVCVAHGTVTIAPEEYWKISHFSREKKSEISLSDWSLNWGTYCTCEPKVYTRRHKTDGGRGAFLD